MDEQNIDVATTLINEPAPKIRKLGYSLLANFDRDGIEVAKQLIDASFTETNPEATLKLVEAMANTCSHSTRSISQSFEEQIINIIKFSEPQLATDSLLLLSRMPITKPSINLFSERSKSDIPDQRLAALDGLFVASEVDQQTLDSIISIANDDQASLQLRSLADELLDHFTQ
jgi:hypothetical protein